MMPKAAPNAPSPAEAPRDSAIEPPESAPSSASPPNESTSEPLPEEAATARLPVPEKIPVGESESVAESSSTPEVSAPAKPAAARRRKKRSASFDALAELEKLRLETIRPNAVPGVHVTNGKGEIQRNFQMKLKRGDLRRAQRFALVLRLEDGDSQIVDETQTLHVDIDDTGSLERLLLKLKINLDTVG